MDFHWMKAWRRKLPWCMWKTSSPCQQSSQKGAVFHVPQISLIQPTYSILKLTKQCGSTCPSPLKNRWGMGAWDEQELQAKASAPTEEHEDHSMSRGTTAAMALGWEVTDGDRCHCACSHTTLIRWMKTSHRNPVRGNRHKHLIIGSSSQFPTIMAETEEEGFLLWQKILLPGDTLACDICVRLLCTAPHGCDRDMACPGHMWLSPLLCQCMTTPGRPLHRELKSNLDK